MRTREASDFWELHKNMNCAFPLISPRAKVAEKARWKITIIENFSENFEKPPKLKRLVN